MKLSVSLESSLDRYVAILRTHNPHLVKLLGAETETEFVEAAEGIIERAIRTIEGGAKRYSALDERGLSGLLADLLNVCGLGATAEREHNGHVDIVIEHAFDIRWKYLGECKIHKGFQYHVDGCRQLLGYCSGRELRAFCLDFFKCSEMYLKLEALRRRFDEQRPAEQCGVSADHAILGAFLTSHTHSNGRSLELLHVGCAVSEPT